MLDDSVESNIKKLEDLGEHTKAQNALLDALASRVGGVAAAIGKEDPGKLKSYKIAMSELSEEIGRSISSSGFMTLWHSSIKTIADYWTEALANHNNYKDALNKQNLGVELNTGDRLALAKNELNELKKLQAAFTPLGAERTGSSYTPYDDAVASAAKRVSQLTKQLELEGDASHNAASANEDFSDKNKLASEHIQKVNSELDQNIQTIKLRALALGKEVTNQDLINQYVEAYIKLIQSSNGLISEANPVAIKLLTTIREISDGFYAFNTAGSKSRGVGFFQMDRLSGDLSPEEQAAVDVAAYNAAKAIEDARVEAWDKVSKASGTSFFQMDRLSGDLNSGDLAGIEKALAAVKAYKDGLVKIVGDTSSTINELYQSTAEGSKNYTEALITYLESIKKIAIATCDASVDIERLDAVIKNLKVSIGKGFDSDQFFKDLGRSAKEAAISIASSGIYNTLSSIGGAMASGESSAETFGAAMKQFFASALQQTSMLALNAGLRLIVEGGLPMLPVAIGLLALGGVSAIAAGAISASGQVREVDYDQYIIDPVIEAETDLAKMRISLIKDQLEKERELRDENLKKIEEQFDMEFSVLQDQWERGIISTQQYRDQTTAIRANEAAATTAAKAPVDAAEDMLKQINNARSQKLSVLGSEAKKLQDELNGLTGWEKFWTRTDEDLGWQLGILDTRIQKVKDAQSLPEIAAAQYGADFVTSGSQLLKIGDNPGGRERVRVEPIGTPNRYGPSGEGIIIQINAPVFGVDDLYKKLEEAGKKLKRGGRSPVGVFG